MRSKFGLLVTFITTSLMFGCTSIDVQGPDTTPSLNSPEAVLNSRIDQLLEQQRSICMDAAFAAMRQKSPCSNRDITFAQLADNSKITRSQRTQVIEAYTRMDPVYREITELYATYGTPEGEKVAQARDWAHEQSVASRLALVNGKITWGQFLEQRMKINAEMMKRAK